MSDDTIIFHNDSETSYIASYKLSTVSDESLVTVLVDAISIESLNFSLSGIFDGYSVVLFNEWVARAGPFTYSYELYQLIYEKARVGLEDVVEKIGEDGLYLLLSLPFRDNVLDEEKEAANELLEMFFNELGLLNEYRKTLGILAEEASRKGRPVHKVYSSFIAHILNRAINELVVSNEE
jgi:hypothetical protein